MNEMGIVQRYVGDKPASAFTTIKYSDLPETVREESEYWRGVFLTPDWLHGAPPPHVVVGVYRAHRASEADLIEFVYPRREGLIRLVENGGSITLQFPLDPSGSSAAIRTAVAATVRLQGPDPVATANGVSSPPKIDIQIPWQGTLHEGTWFSSTGARPWSFIGAWYRRVDVWVSGGRVNVTLYKMSPYQPTMGLPETHGWFPTVKSQTTVPPAETPQRVWRDPVSQIDPDEQRRAMASLEALQPAQQDAEVERLARYGKFYDDDRFFRHLHNPALLFFGLDMLGEPIGKPLADALTRLLSDPGATDTDKLRAAGWLYRDRYAAGEHFLVDLARHGGLRAATVLALNRQDEYESDLAALLVRTAQEPYDRMDTFALEDFVYAMADWHTVRIADAFKTAFTTRPTGPLAWGIVSQRVSGYGHKIEDGFRYTSGLAEKLPYAAALAGYSDASLAARHEGLALLEMTVRDPRRTRRLDSGDSAAVYQTAAIDLVRRTRCLDAASVVAEQLALEDRPPDTADQSTIDAYMGRQTVALAAANALIEIDYTSYQDPIHRLMLVLERDQTSRPLLESLCRAIVAVKQDDPLVREIEGPVWVDYQIKIGSYKRLPSSIL